MVLGNTFHLFIEPGTSTSPRWAGCTSSWAGAGRSSPTPAAFRSSPWATARWPTRSSAAAATSQSRILADRGGGCALPRLHGWLGAVDGARDLDGDPGRPGLRHRAGLRRVHSRSTWTATTPAARWIAPTAGSTAAWPGTASTRRRARRSTGSSRAGWRRTCAPSRRRTWPARAAPGSRSAARSARRRPRCARCWAGRCATCRRAAAPPARHRRRRRHRARRGGGDRHVRLRHAHAPGAPRHGAGARARAIAGGWT